MRRPAAKVSRLSVLDGGGVHIKLPSGHEIFLDDEAAVELAARLNRAAAKRKPRKSSSKRGGVA
jgi:hypothetical protein